MNDLIAVKKLAEWDRLKGLVLDSVSSPITRGRIPELAVCFGPSRRRPGREEPVIRFGRQFLSSKKSAVLLKGGALLLHCLGNGRVVEVVDLDVEPPRPPSGRALGPLAHIATLNYSYDHTSVTVILTRQGEVLVAMGARICFSWGSRKLAFVSCATSCRSITRAVDRGLHRKGKGITRTSCAAHNDDGPHASR